MSLLKELREDVQTAADPRKAVASTRFFKTKKGEYGYGDSFLGLTVPASRAIAKKYKLLPLSDIQSLLHSSFHEERLIALLLLVENFTTNGNEQQKKIYDLYLASTKYINNWDLVDLSASKIVGAYLADKKDRSMLQKLAVSSNLWDRRIAIIATLYFIVVMKEYKDTFAVATVLLHDKEDLLHKAVGWMLREVGKHISEETEEEFLQKHYKMMPRTMLRYAIERFPKQKYLAYLHGTI